MFLFVCLVSCIVGCFFFKQKTAYEMRISDWSSDVCSSDLPTLHPALRLRRREDETTASYPKADSRPTQCPVPPSPSIFFDWRTINPGNQRARRDSRLAILPTGVWTLIPRSEDRRGGKRGVSTCRSRGSPVLEKKKKNKLK